LDSEHETEAQYFIAPRLAGGFVSFANINRVMCEAAHAFLRIGKLLMVPLPTGSEGSVLCNVAATLALVAAMSLSPALAQGPKSSGGNAWPGISQPVDHNAIPAHSANVSFQGPRPQGNSQKGFLELPFDPKPPI
jgi:hypothetical protein